MKSIYIIIAFVAFVGVGWLVMRGLEETDSQGQDVMVMDQKSEPEIQDENMDLSEAQEKIGMTCVGSDVGMDCEWNNTEYSFLIPVSWENDRAKRIQACQEGYINEGYNIVSDGESWYATTDYEEGNTALTSAFSKIGFENRVVSYCR